MKILLLSDTHSYIDERILHYASEADEVWHCGDFGNVALIQALEAIKPLRGVYGNIDGTEVRGYFPEVNRFECEGVEVLMVHIGGYPNRYTPLARREIQKHPPRLFNFGAFAYPKSTIRPTIPAAAPQSGSGRHLRLAKSPYYAPF